MKAIVLQRVNWHSHHDGIEVEGNYKLEDLTGIGDMTVIKEEKYFRKFNGRRKRIIE